WAAGAAAVIGLLLRLYSDAVNTATSPNFDIGDVGVLFTVASAVAGLAALALRWRRGSTVLRQQVKWMAAAAAVVVLAFIGDIAINIYNYDLLTNDAESLVFTLTYALVPLAAGTAILGYGLYEIDLIIRRAIVYVALTAILAGLYTAVTATLQRVFVALTGQSSEAAIVITLALIATLFTPVRNALQKLVDKRFKDTRGRDRGVLSRPRIDRGRAAGGRRCGPGPARALRDLAPAQPLAEARAVPARRRRAGDPDRAAADPGLAWVRAGAHERRRPRRRR